MTIRDRRRFSDGAPDKPTSARRLADLPDVMTIDDMCQLLGCHPSTIRRRRCAGIFPVPPLDSIDRRQRWSKAAVIRWLEGAEQRSGRRLRGIA